MSEIKVISLDLWGTLFDDSKYIEDLNTRRASILETISETMDSSTWHDVLSNECKVYKEYEIAGFYIPLASRVTRLLKKNCKNEFSEIDVNQVISCFERIALEYTPAVNWEILELVSLYAVRNKCVLILSSNTGLISSNAIT